MARPFKQGLDYFELDCHMDDKIRLIQAEFGLKGFAVVVLLFQKIYGDQGYYLSWDHDRSLLFVSEVGATCRDYNLICEIVAACIKRGIFSKELFDKYQILTSSGIQKRYLNAVARRGKVELKKEYLLVNCGEKKENVVNNQINVYNNSINECKSTQRREEKSREEYINNICPQMEEPSDGPVIELILSDHSFYPVFQKDIDQWKEVYTGIDVMMELKKMKEWCNDNPRKRKTRTGIIRFITGWLSRSQEGYKGKKSNTNQFNNFEQRQYDYSELERKLIGNT
jgi:hypothetical protein